MKTVIRYGELLKKRRHSVLFRDSKTCQDIFVPIKTILSWGFVGYNDAYRSEICDEDSAEDMTIWIEIPLWLAKKEMLV